MRVAVIGAGAVGLGLASCLLKSDVRVHFVVRTELACEALHQNGLERIGLFGAVRADPTSFGVGTSLADLVAFAPDFVLVSTKATQSAEVAADLAQYWRELPGAEAPALVLCQNGWGNVEHFEAAGIPPARLFAARVITGFRRLAPHRVEITVHAEPVRIGCLGRALGSDAEVALGQLASAISRGGIPCEVSRTIEADLLAKLLYNCALNPLAALRGLPYGAIAAAGPSRQILEGVVEEIFSVLGANGLATHWPDARQYLAFFDAELLPLTREHEPSMLLDLREGRATEIDALCGAVVRLGKQGGVPTPVNAALATLVRAAERDAASARAALA